MSIHIHVHVHYTCTVGTAVHCTLYMYCRYSCTLYTVYMYMYNNMCLHLQRGEGSRDHLVVEGSQEHHLQGGSQQDSDSPGVREKESVLVVMLHLFIC